jgi:hypothetical protein
VVGLTERDELPPVFRNLIHGSALVYSRIDFYLTGLSNKPPDLVVSERVLGIVHRPGGERR